MTSLLFDEYLSHKRPSKLVDVYPGNAHVRHVGLLGAGDERVGIRCQQWARDRQQGR